MKKGPSGLGLGYRILPGLLIIPLLAAVFGCVSTAVKNREPSPDDIFRENIVNYATTLLGKPYRNGAKGPDAFDSAATFTTYTAVSAWLCQYPPRV